MSSTAGQYSVTYPPSLEVDYNCPSDVWLNLPSRPPQTECPLIGDDGQQVVFFRSPEHGNQGAFPTGGMGIGPSGRVMVHIFYAGGRSYAAIYSQTTPTDLSSDFTLMVEHTLRFGPTPAP